MIKLTKGHIQLLIEEPNEGYSASRFDMTGKVVQLVWNDIPFCSSETLLGTTNSIGHGFFNEFGINRPVGYDECTVGDYFPKLGVGMLQKENNKPYDFFHSYKCRPFEFSSNTEASGVRFKCVNMEQPYAFVLQKRIYITDNGFVIDYELQNLGNAIISTTEYVHNFLSPGQRELCDNQQLTIGETISDNQFRAGINPDNCITRLGNTISWRHTPESDFFFENIAQPAVNGSNWTLTDNVLKLAISETVDFKPHQINLWGRAHVVSPELFKNINLKPGETDHWQRVFEIKEIKSAID